MARTYDDLGHGLRGLLAAFADNPATDPQTDEVLRSTLPLFGEAERTFVKLLCTAGVSDQAWREVLRPLRDRAPSTVRTVETAYDRVDDELTGTRMCILTLAVALIHVDALPLLTRVLDAPPRGDVILASAMVDGEHVCANATDPDDTLRLLALRGLELLWEKKGSADALKLLVASVAHPSRVVRREASAALVRVAPAEAIREAAMRLPPADRQFIHTVTVHAGSVPSLPWSVRGAH